MTTDVVESRLRMLQAWITAGLCFLVVFVFTTTSWMIWQSYQFGRATSDLRTRAQEAHSALCVLKQSIERRRATTIQFLKENPDGIPGIPAVAIQRSIDNYTETIASLSGLDCSK